MRAVFQFPRGARFPRCGVHLLRAVPAIVSDKSTYHSYLGRTCRKEPFGHTRRLEPQPRGAVTRKAVAQRRSRASGLTRPLAEAIRGFGLGFVVPFPPFSDATGSRGGHLEKYVPKTVPTVEPPDTRAIPGTGPGPERKPRTRAASERRTSSAQPPWPPSPLYILTTEKRSFHGSSIPPFLDCSGPIRDSRSR